MPKISLHKKTTVIWLSSRYAVLKFSAYFLRNILFIVAAGASLVHSFNLLSSENSEILFDLLSLLKSFQFIVKKVFKFCFFKKWFIDIYLLKNVQINLLRKKIIQELR